MIDREKVIKGLEWCMNEKHDCYREKGCPYENEGEDIGCKYALHRDALALLKEQKPRVMTLEEYKASAEKPKEERDPVWEEWPGLECNWEMPNQTYGGYGISWRAWTSRPTDEQMGAAPWN